MKHEQDSTKVILGLLIGGVIGAGALYYMNANRGRKIPFLRKVSRALTEVGEVLENCDLEGSCNEVVHHIEERLPSKTHVLSNMVNWVDTGLTLWKKLKKG